MSYRTRSKGVKIPPLAARELQRDIDSAIRRRSVVEIRAFAGEAELSGMDQEAQRAYEIADVIEAKSKASARAELMRIKSSMDAALRPTQADLVRQFDLDIMNRAAPFSVNDYEAKERERVSAQNEQLAERDRRHQEQRRAQVGEPEPEPWWRR